MKRFYLITLVIAFVSCNDKKVEKDENPDEKKVVSIVATTPTSVEYNVPVKYKNWIIGDTKNAETVLQLYKAWDDKLNNSFPDIFADTLKLRIPEERNEITLTKNQIPNSMIANRKMYGSTSNDVISIVSLHETDLNEDWVYVTTYNKWVEKNGRRDSMLFQDNWRLKNGKIEFLMCYSKVPTRQFLKSNDKK